MAGSRKWFLYESDHEIKFAVQLDESNAEAMGFEHYSSGIMGQSKLEAPYTITPVPTNLEMRYCNAKGLFQDSVTGNTVTLTKRLIIPTLAKLVDFLKVAGGRVLPAQTVVYNGVPQQVVFHITSTIGEIWKNLPTNYDSYQDDGDQDGQPSSGAGAGSGGAVP